VRLVHATSSKGRHADLAVVVGPVPVGGPAGQARTLLPGI